METIEEEKCDVYNAEVQVRDTDDDAIKCIECICNPCMNMCSASAKK